MCSVLPPQDWIEMGSACAWRIRMSGTRGINVRLNGHLCISHRVTSLPTQSGGAGLW